jgi:hypothetical protein
MDITACTVSFNNSEEIGWNIELARHLNTESNVHWVIAENSPNAELPGREPALGDATVIKGADSGHAPTFHHTLALCEAVRAADTRFLLIIDPDFFVIMPNWVERVTTHMIEHELSILGVPWHPRHIDKYRYFPAVHFSLFDTQRFPKTEIDFRPDWPDTKDTKLPSDFDMSSKYFVVNPLSKILAKLKPIQPRKTYYTDTGGRLFKRYVKDHSVSYALIDPVYDSSIHTKSLKSTTRALEYFLPDELCYLPKRYPDNANLEFLSQISHQSVPAYWEQFVWQHEPFGFHIRRNADSAARAKKTEKLLAREIIDQVKASSFESTASRKA